MKSSAAKKLDSQSKGRRTVTPQIEDKRAMKTETKTPQHRVTAPGKRQVKRVYIQPKSIKGKDKSVSPVQKALIEQFGNLYFEFRTTLQVVLFILGIWSHHSLIKGLFGNEEPTILATIVPGIEWMMLGFLLRDVLNGPARSDTAMRP